MPSHWPSLVCILPRASASALAAANNNSNNKSRSLHGGKEKKRREERSYTSVGTPKDGRNNSRHVRPFPLQAHLFNAFEIAAATAEYIVARTRPPPKGSWMRVVIYRPAHGRPSSFSLLHFP